MKNFIDTEYCPTCCKYTNQYIEDDEHDRDIIGDSQLCLSCGMRYSGYTGKWEVSNYTKEELNNLASL